MIEINNISNDYLFPTIDFKFKNTGKTSAYLWQFAVEVLESEIDPTPDLVFSFDVHDRHHWFRGDGTEGFDGDASLRLFGMNNGWGNAYDCEIILEEPSLNHFFGVEERKFRGEITSTSEERKLLFHFSPDQILEERFKDFHTHAMIAAKEEMERSLPDYLTLNSHILKGWPYENGDLERHYSEYCVEQRRSFEHRWHAGERLNKYQLRELGAKTQDSQADSTLSIPIGPLTIKWRCTDARGCSHAGVTEANGYPAGWTLFLTQHKFIYTLHSIAKCEYGSRSTYCTIIEPALGPHERTYPISREIPPGGIERFHILIGASRSSTLRLRFKFAVDTQDTITSECFNITIWNPNGSRLNYLYKDGDQLIRAFDELKTKADLNEREKWELQTRTWELERLKRSRSSPDGQHGSTSYPFHDPWLFF